MANVTIRMRTRSFAGALIGLDGQHGRRESVFFITGKGNAKHTSKPDKSHVFHSLSRSWSRAQHSTLLRYNLYSQTFPNKSSPPPNPPLGFGAGALLVGAGAAGALGRTGDVLLSQPPKSSSAVTRAAGAAGAAGAAAGAPHPSLKDVEPVLEAHSLAKADDEAEVVADALGVGGAAAAARAGVGAGAGAGAVVFEAQTSSPAPQGSLPNMFEDVLTGLEAALETTGAGWGAGFGADRLNGEDIIDDAGLAGGAADAGSGAEKSNRSAESPLLAFGGTGAEGELAEAKSPKLSPNPLEELRPRCTRCGGAAAFAGAGAGFESKKLPPMLGGRAAGPLEGAATGLVIPEKEDLGDVTGGEVGPPPKLKLLNASSKPPDLLAV